jgi:uracil-DNA glycosylase
MPRASVCDTGCNCRNPFFTTQAWWPSFPWDCYPGKAASGDLPPRPECAPRWHGALNDLLPHVRLTLLVGQYAQARYLGALRKESLTETVRAFEEYLAAGMLPLPHPSPRNQAWFVKHRWFEAEVLPELRRRVADLIKP